MQQQLTTCSLILPVCGSCITNVTATLNEVIGEGNWKVDTQNPKKTLTVSSNQISEEEVIKAVEKAGYKAEKFAQTS